ncbi:hypothetical protein C8R47DRAFT_175005 [Mycena vitilis]|nr:hypothetical protein C8R47DRAFT_175005 [Mycena vitilis]
MSSQPLFSDTNIVDLGSCTKSTISLCSNCDYSFEHVQYRLDSVISALRQNYSPEATTAKEILRIIDGVDSQLVYFDYEISRIQSILGPLLQQRADLETYQRCCTSALSPIRKLPPEILQTIFIASASSKPDALPVVGQVSQYWRDIVIGTPKLWSNISVGRTRYTYTQRYYDLASLFLERAANRLLTISIRYPVDTRLLALLCTYPHRWGTLRLSSKDLQFYRSLDLQSLPLPMLETFEIVEAVTESHPTEIVSLTAPRLREVILKSPLKLWSLPWKSLTRLQYDVPDTTDALRILKLCPQLEECTFDRLMVPKPADPNIESEVRLLLPLRKLRFLRIAADATSAQGIMQDFFGCLTAPALVSLQIVGQWSADGFKEFLSRSQCELESLSLCTGYMKDEPIIDVLETQPSLTTLVLDADTGTSRQLQNRVITDRLLRRLIFYPDSDCVLPALTSLTLKTSVNFEDRVLLDMIESRWIPWITELYGLRVSRLTHIDLVFRGKKEKLEPWSIPELRDLATAGLNISLQQGSETISMYLEVPTTPEMPAMYPLDLDSPANEDGPPSY